MSAAVSEVSAQRPGLDLARDDLWQVARETLEIRRQTPPRKFGIAGTVGDALFASALRTMDASISASWWQSRAIKSFDVRVAGASLHRGLAGLGLVLASYSDAGPLLDQIDGVLLAHLPRVAPASLQSGVAGVAIYASLRGQTPTGRRLQDACLSALKAAATPVAEGVIWRTSIEYARARDLAVPCEPIVELGVMHGIAGTLVGLSALVKSGRDDALDLTRAGLRAAWTWQRPGPNRFGRVMFGEGGAEATREFDGRWCVGDPGVLRALWVTAKTVGDPESAERALLLLREDAARDVTGALPGVPGRIDLCCGCAAIAHVYRRMHLETGEAVFETASNRLFAECASALRAAAEPSGFLYGRAGTVLALLSGEERQLRWDAILGISLPRASNDGA